jgi:hypothetical protein
MIDEVVAVHVLQSKSRWDEEGLGYVAGGFRWRGKLLAHVKNAVQAGTSFQHWTLTYDPWRWGVEKPAWWVEWGRKPEDDPQSELKAEFYRSQEFQDSCWRCFKSSKERRHVGECMRRLRLLYGRFEYCSVIEFQRNGMPHFHVLVFLPRMDHDVVLRAWKLGGVRYSNGDVKRAKYVAKYVSKAVEAPDWLVDPDRRVGARLRLCSCSRKFWGEGATAERASRSDEAAARRRPCPTIAEVRACPARWRKTMMRIVLGTGEVVYNHANIAIDACVSYLGRLGFLGGMEPGLVGKASLTLMPGWKCLLDQLLYCGAAGALRPLDKNQPEALGRV